jgi:hypothetical protein
MKKFSALFSLSLCVLLSGCCKKDTPQPLDQLPAATQEGKNTFGCLLNGQAWTPKGYNGTSNYSVSYDPTFNGGSFDIAVYRLDKDNTQYLYIYSDGINAIGTYSLTDPHKGASTFINDNQCTYDRSNNIYRKGNLTITQLNLNKGIISGNFEFTLAKPGCDTIRVTNGRFDKKL